MKRWVWFGMSALIVAWGSILAVGTVAVVGGCRAAHRRDQVLPSCIYQLRPGMTAEEVAKIFPKDMLRYDKAVEEGGNPLMTRRFSDEAVARCQDYLATHSHIHAKLFFDASGRVVGFSYDASSGPDLDERALRYGRKRR